MRVSYIILMVGSIWGQLMETNPKLKTQKHAVNPKPKNHPPSQVSSLFERLGGGMSPSFVPPIALQRTFTRCLACKRWCGGGGGTPLHASGIAGVLRTGSYQQAKNLIFAAFRRISNSEHNFGCPRDRIVVETSIHHVDAFLHSYPEDPKHHALMWPAKPSWKYTGDAACRAMLHALIVTNSAKLNPMA